MTSMAQTINMRYPIGNQQQQSQSPYTGMYNLANPQAYPDPNVYQSNRNLDPIYFPTDYVYNNLPAPPHNPIHPPTTANGDHYLTNGRRTFPSTANRSSNSSDNDEHVFVNSEPSIGTSNHPSEPITDFAWNLFKVCSPWCDVCICLLVHSYIQYTMNWHVIGKLVLKNCN